MNLALSVASREEARNALEHGPAGLELVVLCVFDPRARRARGRRARGRRARGRRARGRGGQYAPHWRGRCGGAVPDSGGDSGDHSDAHVAV
jgi:hypothetical protein